MSSDQTVLPGFADWEPDPTLTTQQRYESWIALNPWVLDRLERLADELATAGVARFGVRALVERLRWDWTIAKATTGDKWKINNNFAPWLARDLIGRRPEWADLIETRKIRTP